MEFSEWLTKKYIDWRGDAIGQEKSITKFAEMLGVTQSLMTQWLKKGGKVPTSQKYISALIRNYGVEVYDVLGLPRPTEEEILSDVEPVIVNALKRWVVEVRKIDIKDKANLSPDEKEKIIDAFSKSLGKYSETEH